MELFRLNRTEERRANAFVKKHLHSCPDDSTSGGKITLHFTPTGIGTVIKITCGKCNKIKDISDYSLW